MKTYCAAACPAAVPPSYGAGIAAYFDLITGDGRLFLGDSFHFGFFPGGGQTPRRPLEAHTDLVCELAGPGRPPSRLIRRRYGRRLRRGSHTPWHKGAITSAPGTPNCWLSFVSSEQLARFSQLGALAIGAISVRSDLSAASRVSAADPERDDNLVRGTAGLPAQYCRAAQPVAPGGGRPLLGTNHALADGRTVLCRAFRHADAEMWGLGPGRGRPDHRLTRPGRAARAVNRQP